MPNAVLALGAAAMTASGAVWYLPAIADLRAGDDRPVSTRIAASACVAGWGTGAVLAVLLLTTASWQVPCTAAAAGAVTVVLLRLGAHVRRKHEAAEEVRRWAALRHEVPAEVSAHPQRTFLAWLLSGLVLASATAMALLVTGGAESVSRTVMALSVAVMVSLTFLLIAGVRARPTRLAGQPTHGRLPRQRDRYHFRHHA